MARTSILSEDSKREYVFRGSGLRKRVRKNAELVNVTPIISELPEGIQTVLHKSGEEFSGGERKRLALLRAIVSNPNLIILDEPTAGLDPSNQEVVWNMIEGLGRGGTRIVATHDVEKVILADRVVIMREGSIVACGSPEKLINSHSFLKGCK
ncbi:energy-coupling factor ABC transporter ATP-binding protein [Bacillus cereus]